MSPLSLRRHRAERLLRDEFNALRGRVLERVDGKLRASGVTLDQDDLEACYAMAWQGLYAVVLEGQEIANPTGWLVLVSYRRAIDEHRARVRARCVGELALKAHDGCEHDFVEQLDARTRLRHVFEALRGRLGAREREAATLCYLQGLTRSEAAARMGVSEARMRKLMEGGGPGRPGVAAKVGALLGTICDGGWCEEQASLMRALAFGILDPDGERHRLALVHHSQCPACRAYVVSLRGLAAALPPGLLAWRTATAILASGSDAGARAARGLGGSLSRSGAAGASGAASASGAAGGGWLLGSGPLGAKLAVGCVLALGVGAGCAALDGHHSLQHSQHRRRSQASPSDAASIARAGTEYRLGDMTGGAASVLAGAVVGSRGTAPAPLTPAVKATREFGPERALAAAAARQLARPQSASAPPAVASAALASSDAEAPAGRSASASEQEAGETAAAAREFSPG
ncbi:MAG TPA: sigma-70 family RNA polymerase sigma factor [Solirubrobacteraceae bacterium]|jgi:DNA-directed RNA polymerase specialized sigma24 family protein|nr:sigma-70 family RNA polymerase sigma factor [Solirubrobacteraceae bacterium]